MNKFEQYIKTTPEYKDLVLQHGERLFIKHEGEYNILTMRLAHRLWVRLDAVDVPLNTNKVVLGFNFDNYTPMSSK